MTLPPFATEADVEATWGPLSPEDEAKVRSWLTSASNMLRVIGRNRGIDVDAYIADDELMREAAKDAVVASVRRVLMNPTGIRSRTIQQTATPYAGTETETLDSSLSSARFYFDPTELAWLPFKRSRFGTLRMGVAY